MTYKRKEIIGDCTLYLGDCLEVMPTLDKVDAMLTDPPYGIGDIMVGSGRFAGLCKKMGGENGWDTKPPPSKVFINDFPTIAWGGNYLSLPPSRGWLVWAKNNATTTFASVELAWSNMEFNAKHWIGPVGCPINEKAGHPTQKPLALMKWCIGFLPEDAQTILDPFMGSGTTGVACAKLGRKFIGIELDEDYFNIACERIRKAYDQPDLFVEPPQVMKQEDLLLGDK
jgi:DNA modification methylase